MRKKIDTLIDKTLNAYDQVARLGSSEENLQKLDKARTAVEMELVAMGETVYSNAKATASILSGKFLKITFGK